MDMPLTRNVVFGLCVLGASARADTWLVAEAPAVIPVSDVQASVFRPGVMPALGAYVERGVLAFGARLRVGILRNGPAPGDHLNDPGVGGLATGGLALRATLHGWWVEGVGGGGITGHDVVPALELGVGWDFSRGSFDIGPSARYVRVIGNSSMDQFGSADLALLGVDVRFGKARPARVAPVEPVPPPVEAVTPAEPDGDRLVDQDESCEGDPDGCPIGDIVVHDDRIVLDERVLFDTDRARVRSRGRKIIGEIASLWREHPEWHRITIEGHADIRGNDEYNQDLSQRRANAVLDVLVKLGFTTDRVTAIGYGRSRPRDPGVTADAHSHNRRVEFVIERGSDQ
jgi:OOP family OmpA-OmpF porin